MTTCKTVSHIPTIQVKLAARICLLSVLDWCYTPSTVAWGLHGNPRHTCPVLQLQAQMMPSLLPEYSCSTDTHNSRRQYKQWQARSRLTTGEGTAACNNALPVYQDHK